MPHVFATVPPVPRLFCLLLSFVGGFDVMLLEMCGFRVLPTTFGSSVYVTGILLSLIMIALSLGYWAGGYISARSRSLTWLFVSMLGAVVYVHVTNVLLANPILDFAFSLYRKSSTPLPAIGLAVFVLYFAPMVALSQVTPFLIRHLAKNSETAGKLAGQLMALSTIGSILGTLAPTFWLIPAFGVRQTTLVFEVTVAVVAIAGLMVFKKRVAMAALVVMLALAGSTRFAVAPESFGDQKLIFEAESLYGNIKVVSKRDEFGERLSYYPNRSYAHSSVYPASPLANSPVALDYLTSLTLAPGKRVLVLGTALGAALAMANQIDPSLQITGVEIDPAVIAVSKKYLPQLEAPNIELIAADARVFLKEDERFYDFVLVDLFAGDFLAPHCVTKEFFELVRARMSPGAVMFINSNMPELLALERLDAVERPIRHLESAILNAGFPQLLRTDFAVNGHITAFLKPQTLEQHREALRAQARREDLPVEYRAQLALESFSISEVPNERATASEPFTDDWVPDSLIHRRENTEGHLRAAALAGEPPAPHRTAQDIARWRFWEIGRVPGQTFKQFAASSGQVTFCQEIDTWAAAAKEPVSAIFQYFNRADIRKCASVLASLPPTEFRTLLRSAALVQDGKAGQAWPALAQAIDDPLLTRASQPN